MNFKKKENLALSGEALFLPTRRKLTAIVVPRNYGECVSLCTRLDSLRRPQLPLSRQLCLNQPHHTVPLLFQKCLLTLLRKWHILSYSFCSPSISHSLQLDKSSLTYLPDICQVTACSACRNFVAPLSLKNFSYENKKTPPFGGAFLWWLLTWVTVHSRVKVEITQHIITS
jgi:hypothetical protein